MPSSTCPLYAAIDLGSNSFHMLVVREIGGGVQTLSKIKRKVRLASGLDADMRLDKESMIRGWQCLSLFSEQLRDIPIEQVRIVATATLRCASNAQEFLDKAEEILNNKIRIISGDEEAKLIYRGVAQTSSGNGKRLVIDIGGASTELIVGEDNEAYLLNSLDMGCVTWMKRYFPDGELSSSNFEAAKEAACKVINPVLSDYRRLGWNSCVGASGTIQALVELFTEQGLDERITLAKLNSVSAQMIEAGSLANLELKGLAADRKPVFAGGVAILTAIFEQLSVVDMTVAGGALREGLVYSMLSQREFSTVRQRTIDSIIHRHSMDPLQANRVKDCALSLALQLQQPLSKVGYSMLHCAAMLHEVGLSIAFKHAPRHAAYIIDHADLPGFTRAQQHLLSGLLLNQRGPWENSGLEQQNAIHSDETIVISRILRLAIIICMRRVEGSVPEFDFQQQPKQAWLLSFPEQWQRDHPLRAAELHLEAQTQQLAGYPLSLK
ncbi:guanosine-5'-triphosphate,3'-diphosphate diphosphatase [Alginatibacterium sediminis]|uniref:Guanosine-5'-triphosphate,3'-diphosphate pyrophosphatase n=1 Tax=Alginatibacterium sediminis TaxID=2164068 RepID=A0A420EN73_9ALTE|nr:guanosine-5'-triphosphate,3'-diphosphate diphosphatase [Alginatibacterium sediminis]RKF22101.1 guanosine-5'-triphosphate,3'-diphosphate diphosphatase [Alginatibacterium sediminis]